MGRQFTISLMLSLVATLLSADTPAAADISAKQLEFFETHIRPVLVERCYACHNSADKAEGGLEIDWREGIADAGIVVAGKPDQSRLIAILRHEVDGLEMPEDGPKLDDQTIADFEKWIAMGAPDPREQPLSAQELSDVTSWEATLKRRKNWWSFQPIQQVKTPADTSWSSHPIDRFVLDKQKQQGLKPAASADPTVLIRRLYFALVGLPPTAEAVATWTERLESDRDQAVTELVDQLLDSPRFGERWARHWMDWIRYAESHGSEGDPAIDNAWHYRDYLIRELNADVPYDQLVREHVAGDLLRKPRINQELGINESIIGPAHWRMVFHGFAPTDALDEKVRFVDDQVNAFSKAFLGLTVSCARCHDHKFDAISQQDYYALFGILASCRPARAVIDLPEKLNHNAEALADLKPQVRAAIATAWLSNIDSIRDRLATPHGPSKAADKAEHFLHSLHVIHQAVTDGKSLAEAWKQRAEAHQKDHERFLTFATANAVRQWDLSKASDRESWYAVGTTVAKSPQSAGEFALRPEGDDAILGIYPAGVYSHALSTKHAGRVTSPDVQLDSDSELWVQVIGDGAAMTRYVVQDYPRNGTVFPVTNLNDAWRWQRYDLTYWTGDSIHVEVTTAKDAPLLVKGNDRSWFGIRSAVILPKGSPAPGDDHEYLDPLFAADDIPETIEQVADRFAGVIQLAVTAWRDGQASDAQARMLDRCLAEGLLPNALRDLPTAKPLIQQYRELEAEIPTPTRVPGLDETRGRTQPLFVRGNHKTPGDITPRRFLEAIDATPYEGPQSGRLQLADDLLRDDNPLTRRVIVNRIWHHLFGRGIVGTPDNFGRLGQEPTHPELLDHLAVKFSNDDWSLKELIRSIVLSKTWQQSSVAAKSIQQADPANEFLTRGNMRRLEAESIRDAMLKVSGKLDTNVYGPPADGNSNRRSVYVQVIRNRLDPFLRAFDFPEPFSATGRRDVTNVPAQSLMLMNDRAVARHAAAWIDNVLREEDLSDDQRLQSMFVTALGRRGTQDEIDQAKAYLSETKQDYEIRQREIAAAQQQLREHESQISAIKAPVRKRLLDELKQKTGEAPPGPQPIARWEFDGNLEDAIGSLNGSASGNANVSDGSLVVNSGGYVSTTPLDRPLRAKTLEAWVQLDNLDQRGGGVMTVQSRNGVTFDAIVFGEKDPGQWLAGSNGFARTESFNAPIETETKNRFVHVAISYHEDGMIIGYRDGKPYGKPYQSRGPWEFKAGDTIVSFGVRHLPAGGNRLLAGRISKARLYDRALSAAEIEASATSSPYIDDTAVLAALDQTRRDLISGHEQKITTIRQQLDALGPPPKSMDRRAAWTDLARAMFTFKEFIYVR